MVIPKRKIQEESLSGSFCGKYRKKISSWQPPCSGSNKWLCQEGLFHGQEHGSRNSCSTHGSESEYSVAGGGF